jgi:hypothetical protein
LIEAAEPIIEIIRVLHGRMESDGLSSGGRSFGRPSNPPATCDAI